MNKDFQYMLTDSAHRADVNTDNEKIYDICRRSRAIFAERKETITISQMVIRLMKFTALKIWIFQAVCLIIMCQIMFRLCFDYIIMDARTVTGMLAQFAITIPFVTFPLLYKSVRYKMQEIEMAAHFSYPVQMVVKLMIIGIGDMCMIIAGIMAGVYMLDMDFSRAVLYGMIPFLFASSLLIFIAAHTSFNMGIVVITVVYVGIALFIVRLAHVFPRSLEQSFGLPAFIICIILLLSILGQIKMLTRSSKCMELQVSI